MCVYDISLFDQPFLSPTLARLQIADTIHICQAAQELGGLRRKGCSNFND